MDRRIDRQKRSTADIDEMDKTLLVRIDELKRDHQAVVAQKHREQATLEGLERERTALFHARRRLLDESLVQAHHLASAQPMGRRFRPRTPPLPYPTTPSQSPDRARDHDTKKRAPPSIKEERKRMRQDRRRRGNDDNGNDDNGNDDDHNYYAFQ